LRKYVHVSVSSAGLPALTDFTGGRLFTGNYRLVNYLPVITSNYQTPF